MGKKRKKNAIHPQSRFGRLSRRWSSGDFWWHRCGRAVVLRFATLDPATLVLVGELIYNAHLGNTKGLLSSSRFNVFLSAETRLAFSFFFLFLFFSLLRRHSGLSLSLTSFSLLLLLIRWCFLRYSKILLHRVDR